VVSLVLQLSANLMRMLYFAIDPLGSSGRIPFAFSTVVASTSAPVQFTASFLLALFWNESLRFFSPQKKMFLEHHRTKFIVFLIIFFHGDLVGGILRAARVVSFVDSILISVGVLSVLQFVTLCYFIWNGTHIILYLKQGGMVRASKLQSLHSHTPLPSPSFAKHPSVFPTPQSEACSQDSIKPVLMTVPSTNSPRSDTHSRETIRLRCMTCKIMGSVIGMAASFIGLSEISRLSLSREAFCSLT
jgi:hypothetical protein